MQAADVRQGAPQVNVPARMAFYATAGILVVIGAVVLVDRLFAGLKVTGLSSTIAWGLWVAFYIFFVGLSAGSFLLSTMIYVFNMRELERVGRLAILTAVLALGGAMLFVWIDLGHPERVLRAVTNWQPRSIMAIEFALYVAYIVLMLVELWFLLRLDLAAAACRTGFRARVAAILALRWRYPLTTEGYKQAEATTLKVAKVAGIIGIPIAIGVHGGTGSIFAVLVSRAYWNTGLFPIMFLVSALASGAALMTFLYATLGRRGEDFLPTLRRLASLMILFISLDALLVASDFVAGVYQSGTAESATLGELALGRFSWIFWGGEVGLAILVPVLLFAFRGRSAFWLGAAGLSMIVGIVAVRFDLVVPAYVKPLLPGLDRAYRDVRFVYEYTPAASEWLIGVGVIAFLALVLALALEVLPLGEDVRPIGATRRAS